MTDPQEPSPEKDPFSENQSQQDIGQNQGQAFGQMLGGQVINVSGGTVSIQDRQGRPLAQPSAHEEKKIPPLLPYLSNRYDQEFELRQAVQNLLAHTPRRPLFCILHGDECQSQDMFLERFKEALSRWLNLDSQKTKVEGYPLLKWRPSSSNSLDTVPARLRQNLADEVVKRRWADNRLADGAVAMNQQINQFFGQNPGPVVVEMHLRTNDLRDLGLNLLPKVLEFWQAWPDLGPSQTLIICLSIKYRIKPPTTTYQWWSFLNLISRLHCFLKERRRCQLNRKIEQQIDALALSKFREFDRLAGVVLSKLGDVTQSHVEEWARSEATKPFAGEGGRGRLIKDIGKMFDEWEKDTASRSISMDQLADQLESLLQSTVAERRVR
ncbi:MAG: hypothetical protein QNJ46_04300 [Leptolyngbyaceae cyanobacterium MO_188.B28]|nr:hypothetical protein [Leptolyngbyaceae cyanobacterium MO_188.B28]